MKPPICELCDKDFNPDEGGGLIYFKKTEKGLEFDRKVEQGMVGHPPYAAWFCQNHVEAARKVTNLTLEEALEKLNPTPCGIMSFIHNTERLLKPFEGKERELVKKAYEGAKEVHENQQRDDGEPYFTHPYRVALIILEELEINDANLVASALLHDVIEDSDVSKEDIEDAFNATVASTVDTVSKPKQRVGDWKEKYYEKIKNSSREIQTLKFADRLDNVRDLARCPSKEKQIRYLKETKEVFLPWAMSFDQKIHSMLKKEIEKVEGPI